LKLLKENIGKILEDVVIKNNFLTRTPIVHGIRATTYSFCTSKEAVTRMMRQSIQWEIIASYVLDKGLISRIHIQKLNT
jgi:hypothetical protein